MEEEKEISKDANEKSEELCDSISIGSASKGGIIKCYGSFSDPETFKKKIDNAKEVKEYANVNLSVNT